MLTREMLSQSRIIAKGNRIRDVDRLVESYGGRRSGWIKKSSPLFTQDGAFMSTIGMNTMDLVDLK